MKLWHPKTLLALCSLVIVLAIVARDAQQTSPGEISRVHAQDPELAGSAGCAACHERGTLSESCTSCHASVQQQIEAKSGFHGTLVQGAARECASCHHEHRGADFDIAGARAFAAAGVPDATRFDHAQLSFALAGKHLELGCAKCHREAEAQPLPKGHARFAGLRQDCASCHEDPHKGRITRACAECHGQAEPFAQVASYAHTGSFALEGAHAKPRCLECHAKDGPFAVELLAGSGPKPAARVCEDCHASPHARSFPLALAAAAQLASGASCALCHDARQSFAHSSPPMSAEQHARTGFALAAPHDRLACRDCHGERAPGAFSAADFARRYPGRAADDCAACHRDPHEGEFRRGPFQGKRCVDCHALDAFRPARFDAVLHAQSGFALIASHAALACQKCHTEPAPAPGKPARLTLASRECAACHSDAHAGAFDALAGAAQLDCALCHEPTHFDAVKPGSFDHAHHAGFALEGAHARSACEACHPRAAVADASGRRFGRARERFQAPFTRCGACHADAHAGSFARAAEQRGEPAPDCAACHTQQSFRAPAAAAFDHAASGFALSGAHLRASCESCHGAGAAIAAAGEPAHRLGSAAARMRGPAERCESCHADPHQGRFDSADLPAEVEGRAGCARCHGTESFRMLAPLAADRPAFEHGRWTGWELSGVHAEAACQACHLPSSAPAAPSGAALASPAERSFGAAAGRDCQSCHSDVHIGQFARAGATDCARCHAPVAGFRIADFDHAARTRYALDANHRGLACQACHIEQKTKSGARAVRYRPLGMECVDCHGVPGKAR